MAKYREILRISSMGISEWNIADSYGIFKKTVNHVLKYTKELSISWPLDVNDTDVVLADKLFLSAQ